MKSIEELENRLSTPSERLIKDMQKIEDDILILGVGGKVGPSMAKLALRAIRAGGSDQNVIGVSRFSNPDLREELEDVGIQTIAADLMKEKQLQALPEIRNVIYLVGKKFGTSGKQHMTWAINTYLPGRVAKKFRQSRMVVFSTGNVYPFVDYGSGGATEQMSPSPVGEYAQSCLGRERMFEHFSQKYDIPMLFFRLNYAVEMRYGNLLEIAKAVFEENPIDLSNGYMNVIWQGDANEMALRSLLHCSISPKRLNITGPETIAVRSVANKFGNIFNKEPKFLHEEKPTSLLNNAALAHKLFGYPLVPLQQIIEWTADWVKQGEKTFNKPTHFQVRSGNF